MTWAVKASDDVIILMLVLFASLIELQEQESFVRYNESMLRKIKVIPDDLVLDKLGWGK